MMSRKVPREGLADLLEKLAVHSRKYVLTGMSDHFDGTMYRVAIEGEGELLDPDDGDGDDEDTGEYKSDQYQAG